MTGYRLPAGGALIERTEEINFAFDGRSVTGFAGDTVASALLAQGRTIFGRSFKYHRPRGVFSAGSEEPSALVTLDEGARAAPNTAATMIGIAEGLAVSSQNAWPSVGFDLQAVSGLLSPFLSAGFYYKTFMGPTSKAWMFYEHFIRRAAGMGKGTHQPDPGRYERAGEFCDVLVVGAGSSGLEAALVSARKGLRVCLCDESAAPERRCPPAGLEVGGRPARDWAMAALAELRGADNVRLLSRTTVYGKYDGGQFGAVEHVGTASVRQRHWTITAGRTILATGAIERPLVFDGNDLPGVMLCDAARRYVEDFGVSPGRRIAVFTNNDSGYGAALAMIAAGAPVTAIVDARSEGGQPWRAQLAEVGIAHYAGSVVARALGGKALKRICVTPHGDGTAGSTTTLEVDCLAVSGGWNPAIQLACQNGEAAEFDDRLQAFVIAEPPADSMLIGSTAGAFLDHNTLAMGRVPALRRRAKMFVDLQHDVTVADIELAEREGFGAVEHLKRYTTLGMAGDQGKTSSLNGLALLAEARGESIPAVGTTRFRPPYTPIALGALAGEARGTAFRPTRRTPMHDWHLANGAEMIAAGAWLRPRVYYRAGETFFEASMREARETRRAVGLVDVTTLGKIDVLGPDAAEFLNRVYTSGFAKLPIGRARYGVMLRDDGLVFDDGTTWRLDQDRYLMTTTTANAGPVLAHLEYLLALRWPELKVVVASSSDQWAGVAIAGPDSRKVLLQAIADVDFSDAAFPQMAVRRGHLNGAPVWLARLSFSGERAYEVYAPWSQGQAMWDALMAAGESFGITPYGTEALSILRIEKGHVAGPELDGRTSLDDLGLGRMASTKKPYVGQVLSRRDGLLDPARQVLVGLRARNGAAIPAGAHLVGGADANSPGDSQGVVTSPTFSPALDAHIALGLLAGGRERLGEAIYAADPLRRRHIPVEVVSPHFYDPEGARLDA